MREANYQIMKVYEIARDPVCATQGQRSSRLLHQENLK